MWSHYLGGSNSQGAGGAQGGGNVQGAGLGGGEIGQGASGGQSGGTQGGSSGSDNQGAGSGQSGSATYVVDDENIDSDISSTQLDDEEGLSLVTTNLAASSTTAHKRTHKGDSVRARPSSHSKRSKDEKDALRRCYHIACNVLVGQVGASSPDTLTCVSKAESKAAAAKCLGREDPKSPSNDLRTCMICHECIDGHLKHPSVCDNQGPAWSNAGAAWSG